MTDARPDEQDRAFLKGMRLLYVEDDDDARALLATFLLRRVGALTLAADGEEGLEAFERERPDLVLTDIQMPRLDGLAMAERIRRLSPEVPIVVTTAFEHPSFLLRAIELGVDKYVTKPIDSARLHGALLAVARQLRAAEALRAQHQAALAEARTRHLEAIGLLAGGMAHDFGNLLQIVLMNLELAGELLPPGGEAAELVECARASSEHAGELADHLRVLARGGILALEPLRLDTLVRVSVARAVATSKVRSELDVASALPTLRLDGRLIGSAIEHLARNAVEAMPDGGTLSVRLSRREVSAGDALAAGVTECVELSVRDTGRGVPEVLLPRVFEPYVSSKARGTDRGIGMGLALCRAIVHKHGGSIRLESTAGEGTRVSIALPIVAHDPDAPTREPEPDARRVARS